MNFESLVNQIVLMCIALNISIANLEDGKCRIYGRLEINLLFHKNIL